MVKSGLSDILIMKSITSAKFHKFDLSSDGLIELKKNRVSDTLILSLFNKTNGTTSPQQNSSTKNLNTSNINVDKSNNRIIENTMLDGLQPGIYFFNTQTQKYSKLSGIKSSMQMGQKFSYPLMSTKWFYEFNGTSAQIKIKNTQQEFFMILGSNLSGTVFEPARFVLINVDAKKGKRKISLDNGILGTKSHSGPSSFSSRDGMISPTYTEINENTYKITFDKKLPSGNYFFAPAQIVREASMEFFEFDVNK
jgi:hypothetical protein